MKNLEKMMKMEVEIQAQKGKVIHMTMSRKARSQRKKTQKIQSKVNQRMKRQKRKSHM